MQAISAPPPSSTTIDFPTAFEAVSAGFNNSPATTASVFLQQQQCNPTADCPAIIRTSSLGRRYRDPTSDFDTADAPAANKLFMSLQGTTEDLSNSTSLLGRPRGTLRRNTFESSVSPPPFGTLPTAAAAAAAGTSPPQSVSLAALSALSNLTLASEGERLVHRTSTDSGRSSIASVGGVGIHTPLEFSPIAAQKLPELPRLVVGKNSRDPNIVSPIINPEGRVIGYRQPSAVLRRQMQVSDVDLSDSESHPYLSWRSSTPQFPVPRLSRPSLDEEFSTAVNDVNAGFPDAINRLPGYLLGPTIGRGGFSTVRKGLHLATQLPVAIKIIDKHCLRDAKERDRINREIRAMRQIAGHVAIVQMYESIETERYIYIILEYCEGGSLLDVVRDARRLPEARSAELFRQLLTALCYCHGRGIVHRDVKLENLLLDNTGSLRLADFGLCGYFLNGSKLRCHCGSPSYAAPEIIGRREYLAPPVDVWSAGIVLFAMLSGYLPFHARDKRALSARILAAQWNPPSDLSADALDLLKRMLDPEPETRISLKDICTHPWVLNNAAADWSVATMQDTPSSSSGVAGRVATPGIMMMRPGAVQLDEEVINTWSKMSENDVDAIYKALRGRECSAVTTGYHLLCAVANKPATPAGAEETALRQDDRGQGCFQDSSSCDTMLNTSY